MDPTSSADIRANDLVLCIKSNNWGTNEGKFYVPTMGNRNDCIVIPVKQDNEIYYFSHMTRNFVKILSK